MTDDLAEVEIDFTEDVIEDTLLQSEGAKLADGFAVLYPDGRNPVLFCDFKVINGGIEPVYDMRMNFTNRTGSKLFEEDVAVLSELGPNSFLKFSRQLMQTVLDESGRLADPVFAKVTKWQHPAYLWEIASHNTVKGGARLSGWELVFDYRDAEGNEYRRTYRLRFPPGSGRKLVIEPLSLETSLWAIKTTIWR